MAITEDDVYFGFFIGTAISPSFHPGFQSDICCKSFSLQKRQWNPVKYPLLLKPPSFAAKIHTFLGCLEAPHLESLHGQVIASLDHSHIKCKIYTTDNEIIQLQSITYYILSLFLSLKSDSRPPIPPELQVEALGALRLRLAHGIAAARRAVRAAVCDLDSGDVGVSINGGTLLLTAGGT